MSIRRMMNGFVTAPLLENYNISPGLGAAWSLRKLKSSYNGPCIEVRRSIDNTYQNIGFVGNTIDLTSLMLFTGNGNAYVRKFFDQSANGQTLEQSNMLNQPKIMENGVLITQDAKPAINFDGINDYFEVANSKNYFKALHSDKALVGIVTRIGYTSDPNIACGLVDTGGALNTNVGYSIFYDDRIQYERNNGVRNIIANGNTSSISIIPNNVIQSNQNNIITNNLNLFSGIPSKRSILKINKSIINNNTNSSLASDSNSTWNLKVGAVQTNNIINFLHGTIQEVVIYLEDQSLNLDSIKSNMNSFYNVY